MATVAIVVAGVFIAVADGGSGARGAQPDTFSDPAWAPQGGQIAFVRTAADGSSISLEVMSADGGGAREIVRQPPLPGQAPIDGRIAWPSWAPDARRLVFGDSRSYVVGLGGSGLRLVVAGLCCPAWGPGGRKIAFSDGEGQSRILVTNPDGSRTRVVAVPSGPVSYWGPTWSPHGQKLAFFIDIAPDQFQRPSTGIGFINHFGGKVHRLAMGAGNAAEPAWSPDGRKIAADGIRVIDVKTRRIAVLHRGDHPTWSPDSQKIAFEDQGQIYVMDADGSDVHQLTPPTG